MHLRKSVIASILFLSAIAIPAVGQYDIAASSTEGCTPMRVKFTFVNTASVDTISSFYWEFGNGTTSSLEDPDTVIYTVAGTYTPTLIYNNRASLIIMKTNMITVHRTVPASFNYYDSVAYNVYVLEHVQPLDDGVTYTFNWDIETFPSRTGRRQIVQFSDTGTYQVTLTVSDEFGCTSTYTQDIHVTGEIGIQNVFTPNGDGINDFFMVTSNGGFILSLSIFTRAGVLVYSTEGTTITWDGRTASGLKLKPGIYFYTIKAQANVPDKRYSKAGFLYMYE